MTKRSFTPKAELLWHTVPAHAKEMIIKNVFCKRCRDCVEIVDCTGSEKKGDVVLEGSCGNCGHQVVRVVEISEAPPPNN